MNNNSNIDIMSIADKENGEDIRKLAPNMGLNLRLLRMSLGMTQENVGNLINRGQDQVSDLERKKIFNEEELNVLSKAFNVSSDFFKYFQMDEVTREYRIENNTTSFVNTPSDEAHQEITNQQSVHLIERQFVNNCSVDERELYTKLLEEKDSRIATLEKYIKLLEVIEN